MATLGDLERAKQARRQAYRQVTPANHAVYMAACDYVNGRCSRAVLKAAIEDADAADAAADLSTKRLDAVTQAFYDTARAK